MLLPLLEGGGEASPPREEAAPPCTVFSGLDAQKRVLGILRPTRGTNLWQPIVPLHVFLHPSVDHHDSLQSYSFCDAISSVIGSPCTMLCAITIHVVSTVFHPWTFKVCSLQLSRLGYL